MPCYHPLALVKPLLGIDPSDTSQDLALGFCVEAVEGWLQRLTRLRFTPVALTERYAGNWARTIRLRERPVAAVELVRVWPQHVDDWDQGDGSDPPAPLAAGRDYHLRLDWATLGTPAVQLSMSGLLAASRGQWPGALERRRGRVRPRPVDGPGNVEVQYTAGFPAGTLPAEFLPAVAGGCMYLKRSLPSGGLVATSESLAGWSASFTADGGAGAGGLMLLPSVQAIVARYVRPFVG